MTSAATPSEPQQQRQQHNPPQQGIPTPITTPASPPSKRDLKSWWKRFQLQSRHQEPQEARPRGIFGVPLRESIPYANVAISLIDDNGMSYIYGYVPIVVAKCGVFLKEKATGAEGIFRLAGSEKRIKELKQQFDSPDRYGKGLVWDGYTVHDAANVLRRYLNDLPEPVVPLDLYEKFREPLRGHTKQAVGDTEGTQLKDDFDEGKAIIQYQDLIKQLPPLNRQLLLYILDLLAVFAAKADENRMTAQNLAAIFQPGLLSHPNHAMAPEEYRLNQCVLIFLIENQDHFLIGMQGTAADEQTKQDIEKATVATPTLNPKRSATTLHRSASSASAGAESVSRDGKIRRNRSTSSRHSRRSNGTSTPGSPAMLTPSSGGLGRSNTVPSKKSPLVASGRFPLQDATDAEEIPATPSVAEVTMAPPPIVKEGAADLAQQSPAPSTVTPVVTNSMLAPGSNIAGRSQERLLEPSVETPSREKGLQGLFQRSPPDSDRRQPNKLRKRRMPEGASVSAHSSTASLPRSGPVSPSLEASNPMERNTHLEPPVPENAPSTETSSEPTPRASQVPSASTLQAGGHGPENNSSTLLKPTDSNPTSLHSSFNEGSDMEHMDHMDETLASPVGDQPEKEKKRRWRMSRRRDDMLGVAASPGRTLGTNNHAEASSSTVGSRPRKSETGDSSEMAASAESEAGSRDVKDESRGPLGWIKTKYREARENSEQKRTKSPPPAEQSHVSLPTRVKSPEPKKDHEQKSEPTPSSESKTHGPQEDVPSSSPPPATAPTATPAATVTPAPASGPVPASSATQDQQQTAP